MPKDEVLEIGVNPADIERNRALGAGLVDDPYPRYDELRQSGPVHDFAVSTAFGLEQGPDVVLWGDRAQYSCYDWQTVDTVLRDPETYSSEWYQTALEPSIGRTLIQMGGPEHRRYRALVQPFFTRKEIEGWCHRWVRPMVERILDEIVARGEPVDLVTELCGKLPVYTIASSFGIAAEDVDHFHQLAVAQTGVVGTPEDRQRAAREISDHLASVIEQRRREGGDDLIAQLCSVEIEDPDDGSRHRLSDDEVLRFARLMLPAGAGTTYRGLGCLLLGLLQTGQLADLRADRSLMEAAIEESLRWEQPLSSVGRVVTRDTELAGVKIPEGSIMNASLGAANHDPERWSDPHRFDIRREKKPHSSFGLGPHLCIGMHLARMEMRTAVESILDRLPNLRLDPDAPTPWITGLVFRMPTAVPVVFDA